MTGRRRLGKTTLLLHWAKTSGHPYLYWVASHFPANVLLGQFSQLVWQHGNPGKRAPRTFSYEDWFQALEELAGACQGEQHSPPEGPAKRRSFSWSCGMEREVGEREWPWEWVRSLPVFWPP